MFKTGGRLLIRLGDSDVDYDPQFQFFITTKLPNPHYMPELQIRTTIINFTVTPNGLEDQLLVDVVRLERAELEVQKDKLVVQIAEGQAQLNALEDKILSLLASSGDDILDDEELINTLAQSKKTSEEINKDLEVAEKTSKEIDVAREGYRIGVPKAGAWEEGINTDATVYGGSGVHSQAGHTDAQPAHGHPQSLALNLPPLACVMVVPV